MKLLKRVFLILCAGVLGLFALLWISAVSSNAALSKTNIVEEFLPQKIHWGRDYRFKFARIHESTSEIDRKNLATILSSYVDTVYFRLNDIPQSKEIINGSSRSRTTGYYYDCPIAKKYLSYKNGCCLYWEERYGLPFISFSTFGDYEGICAGSYTSCLQIWWFTKWILIWKSGTVVS